MVVPYDYDNEPFIVENHFKVAFVAAKERYPHTREDFSRRAIFKMFERIRSNLGKTYDKESFPQMKSAVVSLIGVYGKDRSGYHSLLGRYNDLGGFIEAKRIPL